MNLSNEANRVIANNPSLKTAVVEEGAYYIVANPEIDGMINQFEEDERVPFCLDHTKLEENLGGLILLGYSSLEEAAAVAHAVNEAGAPGQESLIDGIYKVGEDAGFIRVLSSADFEEEAEKYRERIAPKETCPFVTVDCDFSQRPEAS